MSTTNHQTLKVLLAIHPKLDALDFIGPLEMLTHAYFTATDGSQASSSTARPFHCTTTAQEAITTSTQGVGFTRSIDIPEAHRRLSEFDVLIIPGGGSPGVLDGKTEPLALIRAFAAQPKREDGRVRFLLSVCTGSLFLASQGVLKGLTAVTHPGWNETLVKICKEQGQGEEATEIVHERYVVNRADEKRGLRVITGGGISSGFDAALWLVEEIAGKASRERVEFITQYAYRKGIVVGE